MTTKTALPAQGRTPNRARGRDYILPACVALACAGAAFAGADTTFDPALQKFTYSLMFLLCSHLVGSNAGDRMMRNRHLGTCLSAGALALAPSTHAQDFAVFEHDHRPEAAPAIAGMRTVAAVQPMSHKSARETGAPSYREALYSSLIRGAELRHGLPPRLLHSLVWAESRFNPMAISPAGAAGLAQLMPGTARALGVTNRYDPSQNIDAGARYLRQMLDRFGSVHLALAAYNAGPGAVVKAGGIPRNRETPGYVRSVLDRWMNTANR